MIRNRCIGDSTRVASEGGIGTNERTNQRMPLPLSSESDDAATTFSFGLCMETKTLE